MAKHNYLTIITFNIIAVILFLSWFIPENHGFWFALDSQFFYFFDKISIQHLGFAKFLAIVNNRAFDVISLLFMCFLYLYYFLKKDCSGKRRMICMGIIMLLVGFILKQIGNQLDFSRLSPSLSLPNITRISELVSIPTKDASRSSFPGDHGLMLMVFTAFMCRYFGFKAFLYGVVVMVIFTLPRMMIGAHWFTDIYVGSLSLALLILSWVLLTPFSDYIIDKFYQLTLKIPCFSSKKN